MIIKKPANKRSSQRSFVFSVKTLILIRLIMVENSVIIPFSWCGSCFHHRAGAFLCT